jgi:bleomycin hydrolase
MYTEYETFINGVLAKIASPNGVDLSWKNDFNGLLDKNLGKDVQEFQWEGKKYTPSSYAASLGLNMDNYVSITSFTNHPMYQKCQLEIPDNWAWGDSYNVSLDDLFSVTEEALKNGYTVAWGADVEWPGGTPPTLSPTAGAVDAVSLVYIAGITGYYGNANLNFS